MSQPVVVEISYQAFTRLRGIRFVVGISTQDGVLAFATTDHRKRGPAELEPGMYRSQCIIPGRLRDRGRYQVSIRCGIPGIKELFKDRKSVSFMTEVGGDYGSFFPEKWPGVVAPYIQWEVDTPVAG